MRLSLAIPWIALVVLAAPREAFGGASARLVYVRGPGAEQCPGEQAVRAAVLARLGYDPFFAWAHDTLFVDLLRLGGTFRVELKLVGDDNLQRGARSLKVHGSDCAAVVEAMALTISLTIDPESVMRGAPPAASAASAPAAPTPPPAPGPGPSAAPTPAPSHTPTATPQADGEPSPIRLHAGGGVGTSLATAPSVAASGTVFVGLWWRKVSLDLEMRADIPAAGDGRFGIRVQSWTAGGSLVPCLHLGVLYGCGVASLGWLTATSLSGVGFTNGAPWVAAGPRVGVEVEVSPRVALRAWAEVLADLTRNSLWFGGRDVYDLGPVSGGGGVAVAYHFL
jgi:hypothetical protein